LHGSCLHSPLRSGRCKNWLSNPQSLPVFYNSDQHFLRRFFYYKFLTRHKSDRCIGGLLDCLYYVRIKPVLCAVQTGYLYQPALTLGELLQSPARLKLPLQCQKLLKHLIRCRNAPRIRLKTSLCYNHIGKLLGKIYIAHLKCS